MSIETCLIMDVYLLQIHVNGLFFQMLFTTKTARCLPPKTQPSTTHLIGLIVAFRITFSCKGIDDNGGEHVPGRVDFRGPSLNAIHLGGDQTSSDLWIWPVSSKLRQTREIPQYLYGWLIGILTMVYYNPYING